MQTWIDNTGLHVVGRALEGKGECPADIKGFLQFLSLLIFSDSLLLAGFESDSIQERTEEIKSSLLSVGLEEQLIKIHHTGQEYYGGSCSSAADIFAKHFKVMLPLAQTLPDVTLLRPAMPDVREKELKYLHTIHQVITFGLTESQRSDLRESALSNKSAGAVGYMLSASDELWALVQSARIAKSESGGSWSEDDTNMLDALLRVFLNTVLANDNGAEYAPAVARAELFRNRSHRLLAELTNSVGKSSGISGTLGLPVPQVSYALLVRSGGNPHLMIEEALKLRALGGDLRDWLSEKLSELLVTENTMEEHRLIQDFRIEATRLSESLEIDLLIHSKGIKSTAGAVELLFSNRWLPPPKDVSKITRWWTSRKRLMLLTDASRSLGRDYIEHEAYENLKRHICKNSSNQ